MVVHGHVSGSVLALLPVVPEPVQLRWGGPQVPGAINGSVHLLDGLEQLQTLEAAGIPTVPFTTSQAAARAWVREGYAVLSRQLSHSQGKDIILWDGVHFQSFNTRLRASETRWARGPLWTRFLPSVREWRFHILRSGLTHNSIARAVKIFAGVPPPSIVRSRRLGWVMAHNIDPPRHLRELARAAVAACYYDLGAVDLLELPDGTGAVLEVNSRPALRDPYTLTAYTKALRAWRP